MPDMETITERLYDLTMGPYPWIVGAALFLLLVLWLMVRRQPGAIIAFKGSSGEVLVSRGAIGELAQRVCDTMDSVGKCVTRLNTRGGKLDMEVRIKLLAGSKLKEVSAELSDRLSQAMRDNLAIEELGKINVVVTGFTGKVEPSYTTPDTSSQSEDLFSIEDSSEEYEKKV